VSIWSSRIVDPGLMTSLMTSSRIIIVASLGLNISETRPDSEMVPMDSLYKLAYGLSIGRGPQCFHSGFVEVPRLCSKISQVGVKNPKLITKLKNKVIQQAWNNEFTQNNFTILLVFAKTVYQTRFISKTMARYYRNMMTDSETTIKT